MTRTVATIKRSAGVLVEPFQLVGHDGNVAGQRYLGKATGTLSVSPIAYADIQGDASLGFQQADLPKRNRGFYGARFQW